MGINGADYFPSQYQCTQHFFLSEAKTLQKNGVYEMLFPPSAVYKNKQVHIPCLYLFQHFLAPNSSLQGLIIRILHRSFDEEEEPLLKFLTLLAAPVLHCLAGLSVIIP